MFIISRSNQIRSLLPSRIAPFLGKANSASFTVTVRPAGRLRFDGVYIYAGLRSDSQNLQPSMVSSGSVFNEHLAQLKVNYQFTRALSVRGIANYSGLLSNASLFSSPTSKSIIGDFLITYLLHPGTALYIGYTNQHQNLAIDPGNPTSLETTGFPSTTTGRQFFIKLSYLLQF